MWPALGLSAVPRQGLLAQDVPTYPVAQSSGLLYTEREMGEVLSKAIYHDVFTLPWPSWRAATEAAARTSGAEAGRWGGRERRCWGDPASQTGHRASLPSWAPQ